MSETARFDSESTPDFGTKTPGEVLLGMLEAALWLGAGGAACVALLRLVFHDGIMLLIWLNSFTLYLYLPAYLALPFGFWRKEWQLAVVSSFAILMHVFWVGPDYVTSSAKPVTPPKSTLTVFSGNLLMINDDLAPILQEIEAAKPDVIAIQEYSHQAHLQFHGAGLFEKYTHHVEQPQQDSFGVAFLSRLPTKDLGITWVEDTAFPEARVQVDQQWVRVISVHTLPPRIASYVDVWRKQLDWLLAETKNTQEPLLLIGDFNATQHSRFFSDVHAAGGRNLHKVLGRGSATTFPNGHGPIPSIRLDHAFVAGGLVPLSIEEGEGRGSDHRPLLARVAVPNSKR